MTVLNIPPKDRKEWRGIFPSVFAGDFSQSWNIDLERSPGRLCLSGGGKVLFRSDTTNAFGVPIKFISSKTGDTDGVPRMWAFTSKRVLRSDSTELTGWVADTFANSPGLAGGTLATQEIYDAINHGDTELFDTFVNALIPTQDRILVSLKGQICLLTPNVGWVTDTTAIPNNVPISDTSVYPHLFGKVQQLVAVTDYNALHTIDKNDVVVAKRIVFPSGMHANCVYTSKDRFWIGLMQNAGGDGLIISWDGFSEGYIDYRFPGTPISGWVKNGIPYFINQYGQILTLNGDDFEEITHFPIFEERVVFDLPGTNESGSTTDTTAAYFSGIHRHGCVVDGRIIRILVAAPLQSVRMRSGIWVFDPDKGNLYHNQSLTDYDDTTTRRDYGQPIIVRPGALFNITYKDPNGRLLAGGMHYNSYDTAAVEYNGRAAIYRFLPNDKSDTTIQTARGYLVSPIVPADGLQDIYQKLWAKFRPFAHGDNRIVVKFRAIEPLQSESPSIAGKPVQLGSPVVWLSATQFRADSPASLPAEVKVGHEVEVMAGRNAGCLFHITAIADTNGAALTPTDTTTAVVTIDESAPSGDTFKSLVRFDNWVKIEELSDTAKSFHAFVPPGADSDGNAVNVGDFGQFKIELRGKIMEVDEYLVVHEPSLVAE